MYIKVGRQEYKKVSHLYDVKVIHKKGAKNADALRIIRLPSHEDQILSSGGYVIRTYHRLTEIENVFRILKSELGIRPLYHSRDDRIVVHIFIAILAYHATHMVRTQLKGINVHDSWATIRGHLNKVRRIKTHLVKKPIPLSDYGG